MYTDFGTRFDKPTGESARRKTITDASDAERAVAT